MASMTAAKLPAAVCRSRASTGGTPARSSSRSVAARAAAPRPANDQIAGRLPAAVAGLLGVGATAAHASELPAALVDSATVASAVQAAEAAVEQVAAAVQDGSASPVLVEAVREAEAALAAAEAAAESGSSSAAEALSEAAAAVSQASAAAQSSGAGVDILAGLAAASAAVQEAAVTALESTGVDAAAVAATAAAGAATATSVATNVYTFLTTTEPAVLAYDALGAIAVAYLTPPLAKAGLDAARGYAGDVLPTSALDCLASDSNSVMVDIRSVALKEANGVPDLPDNDKLLELPYVSLDGSADELRSVAEVEAEMTAVQVANLRRASTGKILYVLDAEGAGPAKAVARQLRKRGFAKVFVIQGGCANWAAAKLTMRPWKNPAALLPQAAESANKARVEEPEVTVVA